MADDVIVNVRRAMRQQLLTVPGLPVDNARQWDGMLAFTPPNDGTLWFRETMLRQPGGPQVVSIGTQARLRHTFGYRITLFGPADADNDVYDLESLAGALRTAFPHSLDLMYASQLVRCTGTGIGTVAPDLSQANHVLMCPVTIACYADTFNPI
jgi:hypothetical protein